LYGWSQWPFFREVEAFDYKCEAFIRIMRVFEDMEDMVLKEWTLIRNLRLFQRF
jgi:hypothetical protein